MSDSEYGPPSGSACRVPAYNLKTVAFPDCVRKCAFVEIMGVGECESACPWKFDHTGNPVDGEKLLRKKRSEMSIKSGALLACCICGKRKATTRRFHRGTPFSYYLTFCCAYRNAGYGQTRHASRQKWQQANSAICVKQSNDEQKGE